MCGSLSGRPSHSGSEGTKSCLPRLAGSVGSFEILTDEPVHFEKGEKRAVYPDGSKLQQCKVAGAAKTCLPLLTRCEHGYRQ